MARDGGARRIHTGRAMAVVARCQGAGRMRQPGSRGCPDVHQPLLSGVLPDLVSGIPGAARQRERGSRLTPRAGQEALRIPRGCSGRGAGRRGRGVCGSWSRPPTGGIACEQAPQRGHGVPAVSLGSPGAGLGGGSGGCRLARRGTEDAGSQQDAEGPLQQPRASIPPRSCMLRPQTPAGDARPRAAAGRAAPASPSSQAASAPCFATGRHAASIADSGPCLCPPPAASRAFWGSLPPAAGAGPPRRDVRRSPGPPLLPAACPGSAGVRRAAPKSLPCFSPNPLLPLPIRAHTNHVIVLCFRRQFLDSDMPRYYLFPLVFFPSPSALSLSPPRTSALSLPPVAALGSPAPPPRLPPLTTSRAPLSHAAPSPWVLLFVPIAISLLLALALAGLCSHRLVLVLFSPFHFAALRHPARDPWLRPPCSCPSPAWGGCWGPVLGAGLRGSVCVSYARPAAAGGLPAPAQPCCVRRCSGVATVAASGRLGPGSAKCHLQHPEAGPAWGCRGTSVCLSVCPSGGTLSQQGARGRHRWPPEHVGSPWCCPWALRLLQGDAHLVWQGRLRKPPPAAWAEAGELLCPARPGRGHLSGPRRAERLLRDPLPPQGSCREGRVQGGRSGAAEGFPQHP